MLTGYTELEYVTSNGSPRIDFSTVNFNGASFEMEFTLKYETAAKRFNLFGTTGNSTTLYGTTGYNYSGRKITFQYDLGVTRKDAYPYVDYKTLIRFTHSGSSNTLYIKNLDDETETTGTFSRATITADNYLRLFNGPSNEAQTVYLYGAKITWNNVLILDLVPCLRDADQVAGFYDVLNDVFYDSDVSDQFIAGPPAGDPATVNITIEGSGAYTALPGTINIGDTISTTAQPANNYIFGGWYRDGVLLSNNRTLSLYVDEDEINLICKFVSTEDKVPGLRRRFSLYKSTGDTTTRQADDQLIKNIDLYFPRVYKSFKDKTGAVYGSHEWVTGYMIPGTDTSVFDDYVEYRESKICMLASGNYISNFVTDIPFDMEEPKANGFNYRLVDQASGYYVTISVSKSGDYAQGYFYDNEDNLIVGGLQAIYNRDWNYNPVAWTTFGITGFLDGTPDEESAIIPIQFSTLAKTKNVRIASDSDGVLQGNADLLRWFLALSQPHDNYDPDDPGANSGPGGGDGSFDFAFDFTPIEELPERISAVSSGFVALYQIPDTATMNNISGYMWSSDFFDNTRKFIEKPENVIISLHILPVELSGTEVTNEVMQAAGVKFFEPGHAGDSNYYIKADRVNNQYYIYDLGTIDCPEVWGSQLDYQPYTQAEIYLPYIGTQAIDIDEIAGTTIGLVYAIDLLSGDCMAFIAVDGNLKYQFSGNCLSNIPYSATSKDYLTSAITLAAGIGAVATGGASAAAAGAVLAGTANLIKKDISHGGGISGTRGFLSLQKPVLYLRRPSQNEPIDYARLKGYPSNITAQLSSLNGFTVVDSIHLENIAATGEEKDEIIQLLKGGVII